MYLHFTSHGSEAQCYWLIESGSVLCLVAGGAVMLLVYEYVSGWLQRNW